VTALPGTASITVENLPSFQLRQTT
jgi:hypothetical protein